MTLDTSNFWEVVEGTETVSLYQRQQDGTFSGLQTVENAKRRAPTLLDLQGGRLLAKETLVWHLWTDKLAGTVPKNEDKIVGADGAEWIVKQVETHSFANRFRCTCTKGR